MIQDKVDERTAAKARKDFAAADAIRLEIEAMGVELQDSPTGTTWRAKSRL
jgi:cysteinyl-tRNA synthetase